MTLLERIKALCSERGISINKFEKEAGLTRGSVAKWDDHEPSGQKLKKAADYFGVSVHYLLTGKDGGLVASYSPYYPEDEDDMLLDENGNPLRIKEKAPAAEAEDALPEDIRMIARAGKRMEPEKRAEMVRILKAIFPEEFKE